jgi:transcriptional regulator with XRE-family HTH domain
VGEQPDDGWASFAREFGIRLHRARIEAALTQEELAYAAGLTRSHYQQLEKGLSRPGAAANPSLRTIVALADVLGLPLDALVPPLDHPGREQRPRRGLAG